VTGRQISDEDRILEFGGGYGEMPHLLYRVCNPQYYMVYDFPEMSLLQRWYWETYMGIDNGPPWTTSHLEEIQGTEPTIMVSMCGLSEVPLRERADFLDIIKPESILIKYQGDWIGIDNTKFFPEYANRMYHNVHLSTMPNHVGHQMMIAWGLK
jgi:hypothetical protein